MIRKVLDMMLKLSSMNCNGSFSRTKMGDAFQCLAFFVFELYSRFEHVSTLWKLNGLVKNLGRRLCHPISMASFNEYGVLQICMELMIKTDHNLTSRYILEKWRIHRDSLVVSGSLLVVTWNCWWPLLWRTKRKLPHNCAGALRKSPFCILWRITPP